jgi:hypothetical protein
MSLDAYATFLNDQHAVAATAHKIAPTEFNNLRGFEEQLRPYVYRAHGAMADHCSQYRRTFLHNPLDHLNAAYSGRRARKATAQPQLDRRKVFTAALSSRDLPTADSATAAAGADEQDTVVEALVFQRTVFASSTIWAPALVQLMFFDDGRWGLFWDGKHAHTYFERALTIERSAKDKHRTLIQMQKIRKRTSMANEIISFVGYRKKPLSYARRNIDWSSASSSASDTVTSSINMQSSSSPSLE